MTVLNKKISLRKHIILDKLTLTKMHSLVDFQKIKSGTQRKDPS